MNAAKAISASQKATNSGCILIFGAFFFLIGMIFFYFVTLRPLLRSITAASWAEAQATITKSEVDSHDDSDGTTYTPDIEFEFVFEDQVFRSQTWSTGIASSNSLPSAQAVVQQFPLGSQQRCYFDPDNPADSVLDRSYQLSNLLGSFALIFAGVGGGMAWYFFRLRRKEQLKTSLTSISNNPKSLAFKQSGSTQSLNAPWQDLVGPKKLKSAQGRVTKFTIALFLAVFWNGISWTLFYNAWQDGINFALVFMSLFLLVGVLLIFVCFYNFLKLFNPVIAVAMSNGAPQPGETLDLAWESSGFVRVIKELKLSIIGEEVITYMRGTNSTTERKVFQRIPLASILTESEMRFGSVIVNLPQDMMHSFDADNNKIVWSIEVQGIIPWWPDIHETMPFAIRSIADSSSQKEPQ